MRESERLLEKCGWQKLGETWLHPNLEGQGARTVEDALAEQVMMLIREQDGLREESPALGTKS